MKWIKLDEVLPEKDFIKQIKINGRKICLLRHEGLLYAVQNDCPHAGGILSGGWCEMGHLICPIHRWSYHLKTGRGAEGQGDYIDIYPLKQEEDSWYIGFRTPFWKRFFGGDKAGCGK